MAKMSTMKGYFACTLLLCCVAFATAQQKYTLLRHADQFEFVEPQLMSDAQHPRLASARSPLELTTLYELTETGRKQHVENARIKLEAFGREFVLNVRQSHELFADRFVLSRTDVNGHLDGTTEFERCHYDGYLEGEKDSLVVLSTCSGLSASIHTNEDKFIIEPSAMHAIFGEGEDKALAHHVMYRHRDLRYKPVIGCGHEADAYDLSHTHHNDDDDDDNDAHKHRHVDEEEGENELLTVVPHDHGHYPTDRPSNPEPEVDHDRVRQVREAAAVRYRELQAREEAQRRRDRAGLSSAVEKKPHMARNESSIALEACATLNPAYDTMIPPSGCTCQSSWTYNSITTCNSKCNSPDSDPNGPWCFTTAACNGQSWAYCKAPATCSTARDAYKTYVPSTAGCFCKKNWSYANKTYCNGECENPDADSGGPWCYTNATCAGRTWSYCSAPAVTVTCQTSPQPTYVPSTAGCFCKNQWSYSGKTYCNSQCGLPDNDPNGVWCYTNATCNGQTWSYCKAPTSGGGGGGGGGGSESGGGGSESGGSTPVDTNSNRNVELLIVNDFSMYTAAGNLENAQNRAIRIANQVRAFYKKATALNVVITLVAVHSFQATESTPLPAIYTSPTGTIDTYLNNFSKWRAAYNGKFVKTTWATCPNGAAANTCVDLRNDNAQLLTNNDRSGSVTGLGWVGTMCDTSSAAVSEFAGNEDFTAATVAHEMGHNFGASHDSDGNACASSGYLMAAIADSNNILAKTWSTCSLNYFTNKLQSIEASSGTNCLLNQPRFVVGTAVCGDGIVARNTTVEEKCDLGARNGATGSPCTINCQLASGYQCATGACCDTNTGKFLAAGTVCRSTVSDCDVSDRCTGSSNVCPTDQFLPDGTSCSSAGPKSRCYKGECMGLDAQCKQAWVGYSGNWVYYSQISNLAADCAASNPCDTLLCTNTEWTDYCFSYNCPQGYTCTVNNQPFPGPATRNFCSCLNRTTTVVTRVRDGTPCSADASKICLSNSCVTRPASTGSSIAECNDEVDCSGHGKCVDADGESECACDAGWTGAKCNKKLDCGLKCDLLNREGCRSEASCGGCLPRYSSNLIDFGPASMCELAAPEPTTLTPSSAILGTDVKNVFDDDVYSVWAADFVIDTDGLNKEELAAAKPVLVIKYRQPFILVRYDLVSSNGLPAMDPRNWTLEGSPDGVRWSIVDEQEDVTFSGRNVARAFNVKAGSQPLIEYEYYRLTVTDIADATLQGSVTINVNTTKSDGTNSTDVTNDFNSTSTYTPRMQLSEMALYGKAPPHAKASSSTSNVGPIVGGVIGGLAAFGVISAVVLLLHRRRVRKEAAGAKFLGKVELPLTETPTSRATANSIPFVGLASVHSLAPESTLSSMESLPDGWSRHEDDSGNPYYYNDYTKQTQWEKPF